MSSSFSETRGQAQPLLHHGWRHEEAGGDLLLASTLLMQRLERAKLVQWMQSDPMDIFCERVLFDCGQRAGSRTTQGINAVFERRFCWTRRSSAR